MSNEFVLSRDVTVEVYAESSASVFVLGLSLLGGSDVLGTSTKSWQEITADVAQMDLYRGYSLENAILAAPDVGTASIVLRGNNFDPGLNKRIRPNTPIRVKATINPDTAPTDLVVWQGYIKEVSTQYTPDGLTFVQIGATDVWDKLLNFTIPYYYKSNGFANGQLDPIVTAYNTYALPPGDPYGALTVSYGTRVDTNATLFLGGALTYYQGSVAIQRIMDGEAGYLIQRRDGSLFFYYRTSADTSPATKLKLTSATPTLANEVAYSSIDLTWDTTGVINQVECFVTSNPNTYATRTDTDSVDLYGNISAQVYIDSTDSVTYPTIWANSVTLARPGYDARTVTFNAVNRAGILVEQALKQELHEYATVYFNNGTLNYTADHLVRGIQHYMTADNWQTTMTLWKGI